MSKKELLEELLRMQDRYTRLTEGIINAVLVLKRKSKDTVYQTDGAYLSLLFSNIRNVLKELDELKEKSVQPENNS